MTAPAVATHRLLVHPATPGTAVRCLQVRVDASGPHAWRLHYELQGDLAALRLPPPAAMPAATDDLWRHTCFEAFVGAEGSPAYHEFNFSPSGDWAAYAFSAERIRDAQVPALPAPRIRRAQDGAMLQLQVDLPCSALPPGAGLLGLSAVIEAIDGQLSYWALRHPRAQPDFHHRAGWSARLPSPPIHPA